MTLVAAWLRRVAASPNASRVILRGSLVTRRFFPTRVAEDIDHLILDAPDVAAVQSIIEDIAGSFTIESRETLWPHTPHPGFRAIIRDAENTLQIDAGFGDPLTLAPEAVTIEGVTTLAVRAELMVAWKLHGLVELGARGRWRPKDLHDIFLYSQLDLDRDEVKKAIDVAFTSRGHTTALLLPLFTDVTWGTSRGSRNRWKKFRKTLTSAPELADVIAKVRGRWAAVVV